LGTEKKWEKDKKMARFTDVENSQIKLYYRTIELYAGGVL